MNFTLNNYVLSEMVIDVKNNDHFFISTSRSYAFRAFCPYFLANQHRTLLNYGTIRLHSCTSLYSRWIKRSPLTDTVAVWKRTQLAQNQTKQLHLVGVLKSKLDFVFFAVYVRSIIWLLQHRTILFPQNVFFIWSAWQTASYCIKTRETIFF